MFFNCFNFFHFKSSYRCRFFDEFGGFLENTLPDHEDNQNGNAQERRICIYPSLDMKRKASAYYIVCYRKFYVLFLFDVTSVEFHCLDAY